MAFTWIQEKYNTAIPGSSVAVGSGNSLATIGAGHLVIATLKFTVAAISAVSVTDNASTPNTYALAVGPIGTESTGGNNIQYQFYGVAVTGGATTITASWTGATADALLTIDEFSGNASTNATVFDKSANVIQGTAATSLVFASFSPTSSGELIMVQYGIPTASTNTAGTNYVIGDPGSASGILEYRLSGTTSETAPLTVGTLSTYTGIAGMYKGPSVTIAQVGATLTATGGTQSVTTVNDVSIAQVGATLTASGGTQSAATVNVVAIVQVAASVTATGGVQSVLGDVPASTGNMFLVM